MKGIMTKAHRIAKYIVLRTEDYRIALSFALKLVWEDTSVEWNLRQIVEYYNESLDTYNRGVTGEVEQDTDFVDYENAIIPDWILIKNLTEGERSAVLASYDRTVKHETAKAVLFRFETDYGWIEMWAPKSVLKIA